MKTVDNCIYVTGIEQSQLNVDQLEFLDSIFFLLL
jgi:hypothetical protein